jgi:hypothetical protein
MTQLLHYYRNNCNLPYKTRGVQQTDLADDESCLTSGHYGNTQRFSTAGNVAAGFLRCAIREDLTMQNRYPSSQHCHGQLQGASGILTIATRVKSGWTPPHDMVHGPKQQ